MKKALIKELKEVCQFIKDILIISGILFWIAVILFVYNK